MWVSGDVLIAMNATHATAGIEGEPADDETTAVEGAAA